jgi:hypothetical protein
MSPPLRIVAIIAAHNEADIIGQTIEDLVAQDIQVYLLDHASSDGTADVAEAYLGRGLLHIERFVERNPSGQEEADRFAILAIIARKEQLTHELEADWFINHDADEFRESPWSHLNFRQGIDLVDRLGYSAIDFQVLNFWPTHDRLPPGGNVREAFRHYAFGDWWDSLQVRCWKNTGQSVDLVSKAGHEAQFEGRRIFPIRFLLRHYPIRSQAHGARKVFEQRLPRFAPEERARGWHIQYDALEKDHNFIRDPATLQAYDPEAVRVMLQLRHRGVEALEEETRALRQHLDETSGALRDAVQTHVADRDALQSTLDRQQAEAELAKQQLDQQAQQLVALGELLQQQQSEAERQRLESAAEQQALNERILDLEGRLAGICASNSWRLTAPLRAARRLLTARDHG